MSLFHKTETACFSHQGRRPGNEDAFGTYDFKKNNAGLIKLLIVADGIGGHAAGEVASKTAVDAVIASVGKASHSLENSSDLKSIITSALVEANREIFIMASQNPSYRGMGTTIAMALVLTDRAITANIGDSRVYLFTDNKIMQLSEDHTVMAEILKSRTMSEQEIRDFPHKHVITRSLGDEDPPAVFFNEIPLNSGSVLVLCSDGMSDVLSDTAILEQIQGTPDIRTAVENLGRKAYYLGSKDNITVLGMEVGNLSRTSRSVPIEKPVTGTVMDRKSISSGIRKYISGMLGD